MSLKGDRIHLEYMEEEIINWESYFIWMNDPEVNKYMETRYQPQTRNDIKTYYYDHVHKKDDPWFAICMNGTFEHIGNIKLGPINWIHRHGDISLFIGRKDLWGKGYGTEAINLITGYAFKTLNLHKVKAGIYLDNVSSTKAFKKCGFKEIGYLGEDRFIDGSYTDLLVMERINDGSHTVMINAVDAKSFSEMVEGKQIKI